jgi:Cu-Zn family superoxide dismutase
MKNLVLLTTAMLAVACASTPRATATATLAPTSGSTAGGTLTLREMKDGRVEATINLTGVPPGTHGFHIHEKGDCGDNGNAAGGHYNPTSMAHGAPNATSHHAGDFGNVEADASGNVSQTVVLTGISVTDPATNAIGHAVILHGNPDDLVTQPSGNAGPRIACGVVMAGTSKP